MEQETDPKEKLIAPSLFLGAAVVYNAILAFLNDHVMHVSQGTVVMAEGIIVLGAVAYMATKLKYLRNCQPIFLFLSFRWRYITGVDAETVAIVVSSASVIP